MSKMPGKGHKSDKRVGAKHGHKEFACGCRGLGKYCHTCAQVEAGILYKKDDGKYAFSSPSNGPKDPKYKTRGAEKRAIREQKRKEQLKGVS